MSPLSRLLEAALDNSQESKGAAPVLVTPTRDCVLPPAVPQEDLPAGLNAALRPQNASSENHRLNTPTTSLLGNPPLSLRRLVEDLGPEATSPENMNSLVRALAHFGRPSETAVSSALLYLSSAETSHTPGVVDSRTMFNTFSLFCSDSDAKRDPEVQRAAASLSPSVTEYRVDVFAQAVNSVALEHKAPLDWKLVITSLDVGGLEKKLSRSAFVQIAKAYAAANRGNLIPAEWLLDSWSNPNAQLAMISNSLLAAELVDWKGIEPFNGATTEDMTSPLSRVLLIQRLIELDALSLLQYALQQNSDLLLLSLTCAKPKKNDNLQQKLTVTLFPPLMHTFPKSEKVLRQLWRLSQSLVEAAMISEWKKDPKFARIAVTISAKIQALDALMMSAACVEFVLEMAMLAYKRGLLNMDTWLPEYLNSHSGKVVPAITMHFAKKMHVEGRSSLDSLSVNAMRIIFRSLMTHVQGQNTSVESNSILESIHEVHRLYSAICTPLRNLGPIDDISDPRFSIGLWRGDQVFVKSGRNDDSWRNAEPLPGSSKAAALGSAFLSPPPSERSPGSVSTCNFPPLIEKEADIFFDAIYNKNKPTEDAVESLRRLRDSSSDFDVQTVRCTLYTVFDEYRFLERYPPRELEITARLFGTIIREQLLSRRLQSWAKRIVLDSIAKMKPNPEPVGGLATFGILALEQFVARLQEWPRYCQQLLKYPRLKTLRPPIAEEIRLALETWNGPIPSAAEHEIDFEDMESTLTHRSHAVSSTRSNQLRVPHNESSNEPATNRAWNSSTSRSGTSTPRREASGGGSPSVMTLDGALSPINLKSLLGITIEEATQIIVPNDIVQDKIGFIFNNLSEATMKDKVRDMLDILEEEHVRFFSIYVVVKRASAESNFHSLYLTMLERMAPKTPTLMPLVLETSHKRIRVLLSSDKVVSIPGERSVLKSLGSWLGSLTVARDLPILGRNLDLKDLLAKAYSSGRLIAVVPFVSKVVEATMKSHVFNPSQPWIKIILMLMKEIYSLDDLKLNLKFELQLLFKAMKITLDDMPASDLLKKVPAPDKNNNPDFSTRKISSSPTRAPASTTAASSPEMRGGYASSLRGRPGIPVFSLSEAQSNNAPVSSLPASLAAPSSGTLEMGNGMIPNTLHMGADAVGNLSTMLANSSLNQGNIALNQVARGPLNSGSSSPPGGVLSSVQAQRVATSISAQDFLVSNLGAYVTVSPSLSLFQTHPSLKHVLPIAIDRAVREIIHPVVERSCAIAFLTTKELTLKDFGGERDTSSVRRAAGQMVQQLAGSLAMVTSKEPLKMSLENQLVSLLGRSYRGEQVHLDHASKTLAAANLDLGCAIIERFAKEKAARDLNEKIAPALSSRRPQQTPYNRQISPSAEVHRVYDDFSRIPRPSAAQQQQSTAATSVPQSSTVPQRQQPVMSTSIPSAPNAVTQAPTVNGASPFVVEPRTTLPSADVSSGDVMGATHAGRMGIGGQLGNDVGHPTANQRPVHHTSEIRQAKTLYGSPVTQMGSHPEVVAALQSAVRSSATSGHLNNSGAHPVSSPSALSSGEERLSTQQVLERFNVIYPQLCALITSVAPANRQEVSVSSLPSDHQIHSMWIQIPAAVKRSVTADEAGMAVAQKVFKGLYEGDSSLYREVHVLILEGLRESCRRLSKELVSWLAYSEDRKKFHKECTLALLKPGSLLNITNYDEILAKSIDNGRNITALEFACFLVQRAVIDEQLATAMELALTLDVISKVGKKSNAPHLPFAPDGLLALVEASRKVVAQPATSVSGASHDQNLANHKQQSLHNHSKEAEQVDPPEVREHVASALTDWHRLLVTDAYQPLSEQVLSTFLSHLRANFLNTEEGIEQFCRVFVDLLRSVTVSLLPPNTTGRSELHSTPYAIADVSMRLISTLARSDVHSEGASRAVLLLNHFLIAIVRSIIKAPVGSNFKPHFRMLTNMFTELAIGTIVDAGNTAQNGAVNFDLIIGKDGTGLRKLRNPTDALHFLEDRENGLLALAQKASRYVPKERAGCNLGNLGVLVGIGCALHACAPHVVPGFGFSWLQLISHNEFLPHILGASVGFSGGLFFHLLKSLITFQAPYLSLPDDGLTDGIRLLYRGTLKVFLVLLHDFPEFFCDYHMAIVDEIPHNCIQLRNIVLASFPKSMRLPDPFLPELKVDQLPEMTIPPRVLTDYSKYLEATGMRASIDAVLFGTSGRRVQQPIAFERFLVNSDSSKSSRFNIPAFGALVLYCGECFLARSSRSVTLNGTVTELMLMLINQLDPEGRYHLYNAIANQLRYPNSHTLFYSRLVLHLFHHSCEEFVKEQITRVLLERLIANRPHPWGLLVTFVELVKNKSYDFWNFNFVRCAPEIEELFENVAKVCVPSRQTGQKQQRG